MYMHVRQSGTTLLEVLVWISIFTFAMLALVSSLLSFYRANTYTLEQAQAVSDARRSIDGLVSNLREADYASDGAYPVVAIATSSVTFYANVDSDSLIEQVHYYLDGTSLKESILKPSGSPLSYTGTATTTTISPYIRNNTQGVDAFHYYDVSGNQITDMTKVSDVRFVTVQMIVNIEPNRLPNELTIESSATLRNLKAQ